MASEIYRFTEDLRIRRDELMAPLYFQELLEMVEETCLTTSPNYPIVDTPSPEAVLIAQVGTRGIKAALELTQSTISMSDDEVTQKEYETEAERPITLDTSIRTPEFFTDSIDRDILKKTEVFGASIIEESFRILGQDAYVKVAEYQEAKTAHDQIKVIDWLDKRIGRITRKTNDLFEGSEERSFYHPIRLSPKIVGVYPNNETTPTCLGVSIIATSFLQKAGADVLHANVVRTGKEAAGVSAYAFLDSLRTELGDKFGLAAPQAVQDSIDTISTELWNSFVREEADHAAVYARLMDGTWMQFDPNFNMTALIEGEHVNQKLTKSYETLNELTPIAPGIEISQHLSSLMNRSSIATELITLKDPEPVVKLLFDAYRILSSNIDESIPQKIYDECIEPFFNSDTGNARLTLMEKLLDTDLLYTPQGYIEKHLQSAFYKMFDKYVLWGEDINKVMDLSRNDSRYRINRSFDIASLPFLILASMARYDADALPLEYVHDIVELGLPAQRIGLAVLSDFASYTKSPLTASFWMSHWPGFVSPMENLGGASHSTHDDSLLYNNLVYHSHHPLTSYRNSVIMHSFLDLRNRKESEDKDG